MKAALNRGEEAARAIVERVVAAPLTRPEPECLKHVTVPVNPEVEVKPGALGLIETRGYGVHVPTNDSMVKTAAVEVCNVLTVQNRVVCSLIQGEVGAVREALAVGRARVEGSENFLCAACIPQPVPEVVQAFGRVSV